jgi:methionyl-tRNA formyltransferase
MRLDGVVMLAAPTARSRAYIQALVAADLLPETLLLLGAESSQASSPPPQRLEGIHLPDHGESIAATCARAGVAVQPCEATTVNDEQVRTALLALAPRLVIYSGWGGQIVSAALLDSGAPFLHLHSGWLPEYRGSTTLYYALLNGAQPGSRRSCSTAASTPAPSWRAMLIRPPAGIDIDLVFDPAIRADLLVRVLSGYASTGSIQPLETQDSAVGQTYYVIHPVLKHLAILAIEQERRE